MPRKRSRFNEKTAFFEENWDLKDIFALREAIGFFHAMIDKYPRDDKFTLEFACRLLGPKFEPFILEVESSLTEAKRKKFRKNLNECEDDEDYAMELRKLIINSKRHTKKTIGILKHYLRERESELSRYKKSGLEKNIEVFQETFSLTDEEIILCKFCFLLHYDISGFTGYFVDELNIDRLSSRKYLQAALGLQEKTLEAVLRGNLRKLDIIEMDEVGLKFNNEFFNMFMDISNYISKDSLFKQVESGDLPLNYHLVSQDKISFILGLLDRKREMPTHILLYGPAGTGKTSFARSLVRELNDPVYEIIQDKENETRKRRAAITTCLQLTNSGKGSVLIVDEADNLLTTRGSFFFSGEFRDKGWLNTFMEEPGTRIVWIVNSLEDIEDSVLRRFSFSLYFPSFSRQKRKQLWKSIVKHNKAGRYIKVNAINKLATEYEVSAGVIDMAIKQAKNNTATRELSFVQRVRMGLDAHLQLQNNGHMPMGPNNVEENFTLEGLNIQGDLETTLRQLRIFDRESRSGTSKRVRQYNLLFYGPPGTGKSELAKYIASDLDRDLIIKRGSDLLDAFVGMTEKNIANMFAEAESKDAVLVIDEAETFIFGRHMAEHSWEFSHVNEFLAQMEKYQGILICSTNQFQEIDKASVRRFNQKLFFDYLTQSGLEIFYNNFLSQLCSDPLNERARERLLGCGKLTPGDFKNVRDRYLLTDSEVEPEEIVEALEEEERIKKNQSGEQCIGF